MVKRLQLVLDDATYADALAIQERLRAASVSEAIRRSLILTRRMLSIREDETYPGDQARTVPHD